MIGERWEVTVPTSSFTETTNEIVREVVADAPQIFGIGIETAIAAATGAGGVGLVLGGLKLARVLFRRDRKKKATPDICDDPLPRDNSEIEQILSLRQQEQREPLHDAFFGILFEDAYRANPDQSVKEAFSQAQDRFNNVAPLSVQNFKTSA